ncbi:Ppx/GppA phosphatase family protein [Catellatospora tritici]|uniref:Ppx/GppA phosphatase family protein n=1 Tax=Catellatospora tritici TaxID=2851566 RepID=UPI001C2D255A|nr:Ppx/GppA phosphatase family protein [Catellatospora tritici]MBV1849924.1 Ppx/GppA family phosphatase [Catellatospora tritici]
MRLGVLDVGSNTVHLLVLDAHRGAHPWPAHSQKERLRLAEQLGEAGELTRAGADALVKACAQARRAAKELEVDELMAFATSAVRDATNSAEVLRRVREEAGVELRVLSGEDEARMTFFAVRRWFGWSAGRMLVLDIGGGSLEIAAGIDEEPALAVSLPLGAGRLTRRFFQSDPPSAAELAELESYVDEQLQHRELDALRGWKMAAATSKTFRSLARLSGAAPSGDGLWSPRAMTRQGLHQVRGFIQRMASSALAELDGVSASRAHQLLAGAVVAEATMRRLGIDELRICPWALREGVILARLDQLTGR